VDLGHDLREAGAVVGVAAGENESERAAPTFVFASWPALPDHAVDAVWSLHRLIASGGTRHTAVGAYATLPVATELDLATLRVRTFPLVPEPLCPH
jgi:ribosomal protein S12 methylthiotransferase accessory factor